jgi:peptide/nickel transport system permease protein
MRDYIIRRLLLVIVTLWLVSLIVFMMLQMIPGDIVDSMIAELERRGRAGVDRETLVRMLGLDVPVYVQYGRWIRDIVLHGNLGVALTHGLPVTEQIFSRIGVTLELGILAIIIAVVISLPIGILSAIRQDTFGDYMGRSVAIIFIAAPSFWVATLIFLYPSLIWNWSPSVDLVPFTENPIANLKVYSIPSFILGMAMAGTAMRMTRTMMLEVLRQDYIRTAYSKGLRERIVVVRHALKNALIPVVTVLGAELPVLVGGSVIIEQIFALPGMGTLLIDMLHRRDFTMVAGINIIVATAVVLANLAVDLSYAYLDPRVRFR